MPIQIEEFAATVLHPLSYSYHKLIFPGKCRLQMILCLFKYRNSRQQFYTRFHILTKSPFSLESVDYRWSCAFSNIGIRGSSSIPAFIFLPQVHFPWKVSITDDLLISIIMFENIGHLFMSRNDWVSHVNQDNSFLDVHTTWVFESRIQHLNFPHSSFEQNDINL